MGTGAPSEKSAKIIVPHTENQTIRVTSWAGNWEGRASASPIENSKKQYPVYALTVRVGVPNPFLL